MTLIHNTGTQGVIDSIQRHFKQGNGLDCVTPSSLSMPLQKSRMYRRYPGEFRRSHSEMTALDSEGRSKVYKSVLEATWAWEKFMPPILSAL